MPPRSAMRTRATDGEMCGARNAAPKRAAPYVTPPTVNVFSMRVRSPGRIAPVARVTIVPLQIAADVVNEVRPGDGCDPSETRAPTTPPKVADVHIAVATLSVVHG